MVEQHVIDSVCLAREVKVDFYIPQTVSDFSQSSLLLINDGQDLVKMNFASILEKFYEENKQALPLICVGMHCGPERKMEYGIAGQPDYLGRGARAGDYTDFVADELMPFIRKQLSAPSFREKAFAGFSLGGLMALDIVWNYPAHFTKVGVFSGSLWWRSIDQDDEAYDDNLHRLIHQQIRNGQYAPWLKFFFQCGNMDETNDRNNNGIIDSIDDTLDLIKELTEKGYDRDSDIEYLELADGKHDVPTWARSFPAFLRWGWGNKS
jgi:enterochelin esterase-like enzyme